MADIVGLIASILQLVDAVAKTRDYIQDFRNASNNQARLLVEIESLDPLIRKLDERLQSSTAAGLAKSLETPLIELKETIRRLTEKLQLEGVLKFSSRLTWSLWGKEDVQDGLNTIERFKSLLNAWLAVDISNTVQDITSTISGVAEEQRMDHGYIMRSLSSSGRDQRDYHERTLSILENASEERQINYIHLSKSVKDVTTTISGAAEEQRVDHSYIIKSLNSSSKDYKDYHERTIFLLENASEEQRINHNYLSKSVRDVGKNQKHYHDSAERDRIIEWYSPLNFFLRQADVFSAWQPGTGIWLLEHDLYKDWKSGRGGTLWCRGMPGAGKTVLTSLITNDLQAQVGTHNVGIAVIYLNHKETEEHSPSRLLAGIWRQLVLRKSVSSLLDRLYEKHREPKTRPTIDEDHAVLCSTISEYTKVFILVDGLDEYPEKERDILLRRLLALGPQVELLLTSRPHITIDHIISSYQTLEIRATDEDIRRYLDGQIFKSSRLSRHVTSSPNLHEELETTVVQRSDGMFLLAKLHIDSLTEKRTVKEIRDALNNMADDLNIAYDAIVDRINQQSQGDRKLAWRTLSWVAHAKRPLRRSEIREALAVEPGTTELDPDNLPDMDIVLSVCAGLVVINEEDDKVRLIHYTTELYLQSPHVQARAFPHAQSDLTMTCITYLSLGFEAISNDLHKPLFLFTHNPFLNYAVDYCLIHARGTPETHIRHSILSFLTNCSVWWELWNWKRGITRQSPSSRLWIAAVLRLEQTCRQIIKKGDAGFVESVQEAVFRGDTDLLRILLENGVDAQEIERECFRPLLQEAASRRNTEIVRILLDGLRPSEREYGGLALEAASTNGFDEIVALLIDHHVDIDQRFQHVDGTATALQMAAFSGHEQCVRLLIAAGAQVNSEAGRFGTALYAASYSGHQGVTRLLIEHGGDINDAVLYAASYSGHEAITRLLIEQGAKVNVNGGPALWAALVYGREQIAKLLVEHGADVAAAKGDAAMAKMLIDYGADAHHASVLCAASRRGHRRVVKTLIDHGADVNANNGRPLWEASANGHLCIVDLLIENGADINAGGGDALWIAAKNGRVDIVKMLINHGADIDAHDGLALWGASQDGHGRVVKMLIDHGADVERALQTALRYGHTRITQVLVAHGATIPEKQDLDGSFMVEAP